MQDILKMITNSKQHYNTKIRQPGNKAMEAAAQKWVREFNCIPQNIIVKLMDSDSDEIVEVTPFAKTEYESFLPMWGTMFSFSDPLDNEWLSEPGNLQAMIDCGFRVYQQEDYDYIFGIDGAGYDFYEAHWIPLYKARGLQWHS